MVDNFEVRKKMRRRKRKIEGKNFAAERAASRDELERAKRSDAVHCRSCRKFYKWSSVTSELHKIKKHVFQLVWYCGICGNSVKVLDIDNRRKKKKKDHTRH